MHNQEAPPPELAVYINWFRSAGRADGLRWQPHRQIRHMSFFQVLRNLLIMADIADFLQTDADHDC